MADLKFENHGSVFLVRPQTDAGKTWIDENVQAEGWQWHGGALGVERRMVDALVEGAIGDGLEVE